MRLGDLAGAKIELLLRENSNASAFRFFVREGCKLSGVSQTFGFHSGRWQKRRSHAITKRNCARLIEQQNIHVSSRLDSSAAHRENVALEHAVHSRNADSTQKSPNGCRNQANQ